MTNNISILENIKPTDLDAGLIFSGKASGKLIKGYAQPSAYTPAINHDYLFHESSRDIVVWLMNPADPLYVRDCPHRTQQQILFYIIDRLPRFSGAALDARGNGSALAEAARQEYGPELILENMITEGWYRTYMPLLKAAIEDKAVALPKHANVLSDLRSLRVVKGVARLPEARGKDATGKRHGDSAIALGMLLQARKELGSYEQWECETESAAGMIAEIDFRGW